jgi:hypothetical protein
MRPRSPTPSPGSSPRRQPPKSPAHQSTSALAPPWHIPAHAPARHTRTAPCPAVSFARTHTPHAPATVFHVRKLASCRSLRVPHHDILQPRHLDLDAAPRPCHLVLVRCVFVHRVGKLPDVHPCPRLRLRRVPPFLGRLCLVVIPPVLQWKHEHLVRRRANVVVEQCLELEVVRRGDMQLRAQSVLRQRHHIRQVERPIIRRLDACRRVQCCSASLSKRHVSTGVAHSDGQMLPTRRHARRCQTSTLGFSRTRAGRAARALRG